MHIDDIISEFLGALANMVVKNESGQLSKEEVREILRIAKIETPQGSDYKNLNGPFGRACKYWAEKDRASVVANIQKMLAP